MVVTGMMIIITTMVVCSYAAAERPAARLWLVASLGVMQQFGRYSGRSGHGADTVIR